MARSLTVQHEENVTTSPLLTGFLVFAVAWMLFGAVVSANAESPVDTVATPAARP